jgi:hypothetical protein
VPQFHLLSPCQFFFLPFLNIKKNKNIFPRFPSATEKNGVIKASKSFTATNEPPMTSPSSSNSNGQEPQLPPLLPPLRSTQHILQPLSVFPGAKKLLIHNLCAA